MDERTRKLAQGVFKGLKAAKATMDSNWEREGHYYSRIDRVKLDQNRFRFGQETKT